MEISITKVKLVITYGVESQQRNKKSKGKLESVEQNTREGTGDRTDSSM